MGEADTVFKSAAPTSPFAIQLAGVAEEHAVVALFMLPSSKSEVVDTNDIDKTSFMADRRASWERNELQARQSPASVFPLKTKRENMSPLKLVPVVILLINRNFICCHKDSRDSVGSRVDRWYVGWEVGTGVGDVVGDGVRFTVGDADGSGVGMTVRITEENKGRIAVRSTEEWAMVLLWDMLQEHVGYCCGMRRGSH